MVHGEHQTTVVVEHNEHQCAIEVGHNERQHVVTIDKQRVGVAEQYIMAAMVVKCKLVFPQSFQYR